MGLELWMYLFSRIRNLFFEIPIQQLYINNYCSYKLVCSLSQTFWFEIRACGENPQAVDSVGISVVKMRYIGVIMSGILAGLGGGLLINTW